MTDADLAFEDIAGLGRHYRSGAASPVEVTELLLARIEALNPTLNAFITVTAERARAQARRAEADLRAGQDRGPLHGVPIALKDLVDVAGVPTTCGSRIRAAFVPERTAPLAARLEAAGAVLLGKTNMLEFAYGVAHPDYGQANNPHDADRTAGGSSGGSAAAVAAGLCFAAIGTDTGGSIRIPAAYCGVAGLKPTYGAVDLEGVFPLSWSLDHAGPLARRSEDARLTLEALTGRPHAAPRGVAGLRLGVLSGYAQPDALQPGVREVFRAALAALEAQGATLSEVHLPELALADDALMQVLLPEASAAHDPWLRAHAQDYAPMTRTQLELGFTVPAVTYVRAQQFRRLLSRRCLQAFETVDALLSPTAPWVAPHEDPAIAGDEGAAEARWTGPHNLTGFPALSVCAGHDAAGLPVGLQVITLPGADARALAIGSAAEVWLVPRGLEGQHGHR